MGFFSFLEIKGKWVFCSNNCGSSYVTIVVINVCMEDCVLFFSGSFIFEKGCCFAAVVGRDSIVAVVVAAVAVVALQTPILDILRSFGSR